MNVAPPPIIALVAQLCLKPARAVISSNCAEQQMEETISIKNSISVFFISQANIKKNVGLKGQTIT
jgi:hypothetical protein